MRLWSPAGPRTTPAHASYPPPYRTSPPRIPSPAKHSAAIPTVHSRTHRKPAALAALTARTITYRRTLQGNPSCEILLGHFSEIRSGLSVRKIPDPGAGAHSVNICCAPLPRPHLSHQFHRLVRRRDPPFQLRVLHRMEHLGEFRPRRIPRRDQILARDQRLRFQHFFAELLQFPFSQLVILQPPVARHH